MFTNLQATSFKSWAHLPSFKLGPVTGIFGSNSSGKTSILQLLLLLQQTTESTDRSQALNLGDRRSHIQLGTFDELLHGNGEEPLSIGVAWDLMEPVVVQDPTAEQKKELLRLPNIAFDVRFGKSRQGAPVVEYMEYRSGVSQVSMIREGKKEKFELKATINNDADYLKRSRGRPWSLPAPTKFYGFPDQAFAFFQNAGFLSDFELALEEQFARMYYLGPLREYPSRQYSWAGSEPRDVGDTGGRAIEAILASRSRGRCNFRRVNAKGRPLKKITVEEHVADWLRELGLVSDFSVEQISQGAELYRVWVQRSPKSKQVLVTDVGFGVSQVLPVLVLLAFVPHGSTVILEQPEIHLHPSVQAGLADVILEAATVRKVQVIVESHSEHLLKRLQRRVAEAGVQSKDISLYFCDSNSGKSSITDLHLNLFGEIENWPKDFFGDPFGEIAQITKHVISRKNEAA